VAADFLTASETEPRVRQDRQAFLRDLLTAPFARSLQDRHHRLPSSRETAQLRLGRSDRHRWPALPNVNMAPVFTEAIEPFSMSPKALRVRAPGFSHAHMMRRPRSVKSCKEKSRLPDFARRPCFAISRFCRDRQRNPQAARLPNLIKFSFCFSFLGGSLNSF